MSDFLLTELDLISFSSDGATALSTSWSWPPIFALFPVPLSLRRDVISSSVIIHKTLLIVDSFLLARWAL